MDAQAQDRCHRIGQTREVHIYRLIRWVGGQGWVGAQVRQGRAADIGTRDGGGKGVQSPSLPLPLPMLAVWCLPRSEHTIEENILKKSDQKRHLDFLAIQVGAALVPAGGCLCVSSLHLPACPPAQPWCSFAELAYMHIQLPACPHP